jgi:chromosomal replication initiation ATPase DnaA
MNIKIRLKTAEKKMNITNSEYCECYGIRLKSEVMPITIEEWKKRASRGEETKIRLPDFCQQCRKPVDKSFIETTFEQVKEKDRLVMNQIIETLAKFEN